MDGYTPQDHSEAILRFGREHERAIKQAAIEDLSRYFAGSSVAEYEAKFRRGAQEHGPLDPGHDFEGEARDEARDLFWYTAIKLWLMAKDSDSE